MTTYSEDVLRTLNKDGLIGIALNLQSKMQSSNAKVLEELKLLNDKLEIDVAITRNANSLLSSRLTDTERQCWANAQYSRRETLEIVGLPKSSSNDEAETKVFQIFRSLDCNVNKKDLDACHWLKDKERVIVKFCRRKDCEKVLNAKNDLRNLDTTNLDLPKGSKIFFNQSLCSHYRLLWSTSKKLHDKSSIFGWYISNGPIKTKLKENSRPLNISHM